MTHAQTGTPVTVLPLRRRPRGRCGPVKSCPTCRTVLDGGPVLFHCPTCQKSVRAADVSTEFPVAGRAAA